MRYLIINSRFGSKLLAARLPTTPPAASVRCILYILRRSQLIVGTEFVSLSLSLSLSLSKFVILFLAPYETR